MKQQTLMGFERYGKTARRAQFLADMQAIVPCAELTAVGEPFYPKISEGILSAAGVQPLGPGGRGSVVRVELDGPSCRPQIHVSLNMMSTPVPKRRRRALCQHWQFP